MQRQTADSSSEGTADRQGGEEREERETERRRKKEQPRQAIAGYSGKRSLGMIFTSSMRAWSSVPLCLLFPAAAADPPSLPWLLPPASALFVFMSATARFLPGELESGLPGCKTALPLLPLPLPNTLSGRGRLCTNESRGCRGDRESRERATPLRTEVTDGLIPEVGEKEKWLRCSLLTRCSSQL